MTDYRKSLPMQRGKFGKRRPMRIWQSLTREHRGEPTTPKRRRNKRRLKRQGKI